MPILMFDGFVFNDIDAVKVIEVFLVLISFSFLQSLKNNHKREYRGFLPNETFGTWKKSH